MKAATTQQIKEELKSLSQKEVIELCLRLIRFKKENKEMLSFVLFDSGDIQAYIETIKLEITDAMASLPSSRYFIQKGLRKTLKDIAKYCRYMADKEAETQLRLHFCHTLKLYGMASHKHQSTMNLYKSQLDKIQSQIHQLHEDLQFDYQKSLNELTA
ncbi:MAG: hypothetical protein M3R72_08525 [Bacteroidota bacterium]|nr:hypothetical protein [Bacteroidota bacterium]